MPVTTVGRWVLAVVIASARGIWWDCGNCGSTFEHAIALCPDSHAIALVLTRWEFLSSQESISRIPAPLLKLEKMRCRAATRSGFLAYGLKAMARFDSPLSVADLSPVELMRQISALSAQSWEFDSQTWSDTTRCSELVSQWQLQFGIERAPRMCRIRFGQQWLAFILAYAPVIFHCVTLSNRVSRRRFISAKEPSHYLMQKFIQSVQHEDQQHHRRQLVIKPSGWANQHPVHILLEWLDFSQDIRQQNRGGRALFKAAKVIAKSTGRAVSEVLQECRGVSGAVLKAARIKLDSVNMLLFRMIFRELPQNIGIYIYLDSSPQILGCEMFAASFEVLDPSGVWPFQRKLLPLVALDRDFLDSIGKTYAILWVIWLVAGPNYSDVARFCSAVICICSDMGTERLIARMADCLIDFYELILDIKVKDELPRSSLFPLALQSPGWNHGWDVVLKRGLKSLSFFPAFLEGLRALIHFFRTRLLVEALCKKLAAQGYHIVAMMIESIHIPSVAEWRWGTLNKACVELSKVMGTLIAHWDTSLFANARDPKTIKQAARALSSAAFRWQFQFVCFFTDWLCRIQSWGKGSAELEACKMKGDNNYDPMMCGRRLAEAEVFIHSELQRGLTECLEWTLDSFAGCSFEELHALKVCVRSSYALAMKRHNYLSLLPWLLARLEEPGIKERCLSQYASHTNHHPMTDKFLSHSEPLRAHVDRIGPDGSGSSDLLKEHIMLVKNIPFDDSIAEGPHALGNRLGRHGPRSSFAWTAASMRLQQNLEDAKAYSQALNVDLQDLWYKHSSVLQTQKGRLHRPMRLKPKVFHDKLYKLGSLTKGVPMPLDEQPDTDNGDGGDGDDGKDQAPAYGDDESIHHCDSDHVEVESAANKQSVALMREYLSACLQPGLYISLPNPDMTADDPVLFVQVLAVQQRCTTVIECVPKDQQSSSFSVTLQPLERMLQLNSDPATLTDAVDVFIFSDETPYAMDWGAYTPDDRRRFLQWDHVPSSIESCTALINPMVLKPPTGIDLMHPGIPALCLLDCLAERGWTGTPRLVTHTAGDGAAVYDNRRPFTKKRYFQCLIVLPELFNCGISEIISGRPSTYYAYILRFRKLPPPGRPMKCLQADIKRAAGHDDDMPPMRVLLPPGPAPVAPIYNEIAIDEPLDDQPAAVEPADVEPAAVDDEPSTVEPIADESEIAADDEPAAVERIPHTDEWPDTLEGVSLRQIPGQRGGNNNFAARLGVQCPCCIMKSRSTALMVSSLGRNAALYFLGAWLERAGSPNHRNWIPTLADMQSYRARNA